jgi:hypothetical protein
MILIDSDSRTIMQPYDKWKRAQHVPYTYVDVTTRAHISKNNAD